ncbi:glucagon-2-like [Kryptolebias marmoratus]|uniref:glucagon-2-like n=1 Tax=Kryptolebias marmoratus TaxID=37003 RepID=UPI0007F8A618|nr:glucagon-2-like [Kryptolebias marmoratus]
MKLLIWCLLLLVLCSGTEETAVGKTEPSRWWSHQWAKGQHVIRNLKRHSDGTFTNDFSNHLDKIKAKDFIEWLASMKREKCPDEFLQTVAEV